MRELTDKEKEFNQKAIDRKNKELEIHKLSEEIVEAELALFPKKQQIAIYNKTSELKKVKANVKFLEDQVNILIEQNTKGVEEKNGE